MNNPYAAYEKFALSSSKKVKRQQETSKVLQSTEDKKAQRVDCASLSMQSNKAAAQYLENAINTATPQELTLMLYDGTVKFINQAILFINENNVPKAHHAIVRAQNIIVELISTLNMDYEIAHQLNYMYDYIYRRLIQANVSKDNEILKEVLSLVSELRDTWVEAMNLAAKKPI